jgi:GrpB-like predicted nucleotidyltransferase (UPF0157 family)
MIKAFVAVPVRDRRFPALGGSVVFDEVHAVIGPYHEPPLECRENNPQAVEIARQISGLVARYLPSVKVEHVGSTAVPGCGGRGIVDLLIACPEGEAEKVNMLLLRLGFQPGREALFPPDPPPYLGSLLHNGDEFRMHVHVLGAQSDAVDSIRFLRSCLRSDKELARAYVQQKRAILASGTIDAAEYGRQKAAFLKVVLG